MATHCVGRFVRHVIIGQAAPQLEGPCGKATKSATAVKVFAATGRPPASARCQELGLRSAHSQPAQTWSRVSLHSQHGTARPVSLGRCTLDQDGVQGLRSNGGLVARWHVQRRGLRIARLGRDHINQPRGRKVQAAILDTQSGNTTSDTARRGGEDINDDDEWEEQEEEEEEEEDEEEDSLSERRRAASSKPRKFPLLGNKEKKELRAYAHQLGKKLKIQQVGKWGVTPSMVTAIGDALEANELLKLKVLDNCPSEPLEVGWQLEDATEAQMVGRVGRTLLLYRPSLTKLQEAREAREREQRRQTTMRRKATPSGSARGKWKSRRS